MDPKTRDHESKKRRPKSGRSKAERPLATVGTPKGDEGEDVGDIERAAQRGERDFDPNVNQRPR